MFSIIKESFKKEVNNIFSDKSLVLMLFAAPVFYSFFYGSLYLNKVEKELPVVVIDYDLSTSSRNFINMLDASEMLQVEGNLPLPEEAKNGFFNGDYKSVIYIPTGFEKDLKKGKGSDIKVFLNNTRFLPSNDIIKAVSEVSGTIGAGIRLKYMRTRGLSEGQAMESVEPLRVDMRSLYNTTESYGDFLIPGIFILIIQQTLLIGLGESIGKDNENKHNYMSGIKTIAGKSIPYLIMYITYALMFYTVTFNVFNLPFEGNLILLMLVTLPFLLAVVSLTFMVANFFKSKYEALLILAFTSYPVFLISGYSWPLSAMPGWVKVIGFLIPSTPFLEIFTKITSYGAGAREIIPEFLHLMALTNIYLISIILIENRKRKKALI